MRRLWWRIRAFFDRRYKSPVEHSAKCGKWRINFIGFPKKWSKEVIEDGYLYQYDENGDCRGMINLKIFEGLNGPSEKELK